jgi:hypothetical protein
VKFAWTMPRGSVAMHRPTESSASARHCVPVSPDISTISIYKEHACPRWLLCPPRHAVSCFCKSTVIYEARKAGGQCPLHTYLETLVQCDMCCSLFAICYSQCTVRHSPFAMCHSPFAFRRSPFAVRRSPFAICHSPFAMCHSPFAICHSPFAVRRSPFAVRHSPFAMCHSPFAIRRSPFAIRHSPFAIVRHPPLQLSSQPSLPLPSAFPTLPSPPSCRGFFRRCGYEWAHQSPLADCYSYHRKNIDTQKYHFIVIFV